MKIILDVDEVVADLKLAILNITGRTDKNLANQWNWFDYYPDTRDTFKTRKAMRAPDMWLNLPIIPGAKEGVQYLRQQSHNIIWVTSPYEPCTGWVDYRKIWLRENFEIDKYKEAMVFTSDKYLVRADVMIDDRIDLIDAWEKNNPEGIAFLFYTPSNQDSKRKMIDWNYIRTNHFFKNKEPLSRGEFT